ncbi:hypothetical protein DFH27DRAFT_523293 [Peziza echinospora]|nr:hypothetical protein DFH27DRAFT_523293 [Peziza echinospora]
MPLVAVPETGFTLGAAAEAISNKAPGTPNILPGTKQLMRLTFSDATLLEELIKNGDFKVSFGKTITFLYGNNLAQEILSKSEQSRNEVYEIGDNNLNFTGLTTHQFESRRFEQDKDDAADLVALKQKMSALKSEKTSKSTMIVDSRGNLGPARGLGGKPIPLASRQPAAPKPPKALSKAAAAKLDRENQLKIEALRAPLMHLLALGSDSERNLAMKTHAPVDLCLRILQRIGNRVRAGNHWELEDNVYRDLDIWKFPYASQKDRQTAIDNAKAAFYRLRLKTSAPEWDTLVKPEERGKVTVAPPPPPILPRPKPLTNLNFGKTDGSITPAEVSPTASEHSTREAGMQQPPNKIRKVGNEKDIISKIIANKGKTPKTTKPKAEKAPGPKKLGRPPKPKAETVAAPKKRATKWKHPEGGVSAYKSKEYVDSADEDEPLLKPATPKPATPKPATPLPPTQRMDVKSPLPRPPIRGGAADPVKPPATASPKKKPVESRESKASPAPSLPRRPGVATKSLPAKTTDRDTQGPEKGSLGRSSNTSTVASKRPAAKTKETASKPAVRDREPAARAPSPIKRSPLGSPPLTAADHRPRSVSSTPKTLASIGSTPSQSPLDTITVAPRSKARSETPSSQSSTANKRKASRLEDAAPPPQPKRRSFPDANTLAMAKRFKEDYARYLKLYREVEAADDNEPSRNEKANRVIKMHNELAGMKEKLNSMVTA